jgi:hypothetical protein
MHRDPLTKGRSTRTLQNYFHQGRAQRLLEKPEHEPWVRWLIDPQGIQQGRRGSIKPTILQELGRLEDDYELLKMAPLIFQLQPRVHEGYE